MYRQKYLKYKIKYYLKLILDKNKYKLICDSISQNDNDENIMKLRFNEFVFMIEKMIIEFTQALYNKTIKSNYENYKIKSEYKKKTLAMVNKNILYTEIYNIISHIISHLFNIEINNIENISSIDTSIEYLTEDDIIEIFTDIIEEICLQV